MRGALSKTPPSRWYVGRNIPAQQPGSVVNLSASQPDDIRPIAARIDSNVWRGRFNKYAKRYRIGISTFGRSAVVSQGSLMVYGDLVPLTVANNSAFSLQPSRTPAGELLLKYRANRSVSISYTTFQEGDLIEFVIPTAESVRDAYSSAKSLGGNFAGVIFFRWPIPDREISLSPKEVLEAIGASQVKAGPPRVAARDGGCVAVQCADVSVVNIDRQSNTRHRYKITSSIPLEYFLPEAGAGARPSGSDALELVLPPFPGTDHVDLGRVVTAGPSVFSVEKEN